MSDHGSTSGSDRGSRRWSRVCRLVTVEPIVFCYMFGAFLQYTAFVSVTYDKACLTLYNATFCHAMDNKTFHSEHKDEQDSIQTEASYWLIVTNVATTVPVIFSVFFFMGPWGDKVDRKIPLLFPCVGSLVYGLSNLLNAHYLSWPIAALLPGLAVNGLAGGYSAMLMASYSYATHISQEHNRSVRVGIVGAMIYLAATVSVFISGLLVQEIGHVKVFAIVCGFMGAGFLYGLFLLDSIVPQKKVDEEVKKSWCDRYVLSTVRDTWAFVTKSRDSKQRLLLALEITILNVVHMGTSGETNILYLYLKRAPRSFTRAQYGYFKGSQSFSRSLAMLTLLPLLKRKLKVKDTTIVIIGLFFKAGALIILGLADSLLVVFMAAIPALLQGFPSAGLRASMASRVDLEEHGRLFAVVAATQSCVSLATGFIFNGWYPSTLDYFDGTCFMFAASMCVLAAGLAVFVHIQSGKGTSEGYSVQDRKEEAEGVSMITAVPADQRAGKSRSMINAADQSSADEKDGASGVVEDTTSFQNHHTEKAGVV